jgi:hypothetical protein
MTASPPQKRGSLRVSLWLPLLCALAAIGCGKKSCNELGQEYADEIHDHALGCDPGAANPCGAQLPTIVYEQALDGGLTFDGLASNCTHAVNPERTAKARELLQQYLSGGCRSAPIPRCLAPSDLCTVQQPDGGWTCFD